MARAKEFSNEAIAALPATGKRYEVKDPLKPGLRVIVQPNGKKSFAIRYSHDGQYRKLTLGSWPQVRLVETLEEKRTRLARDPKSAGPDARSLYDAAMSLKATGLDPSVHKVEQRREASAKREQDAADAHKFLVKAQFQKFLDRPHKKTGKAKRASSRKRYEGIFAPLLAMWGERDVRTITKAECEDAILEAGKRGVHAKASVFMLLNGFFVWLEKRETIPKSPMKTFDRVAAGSNRERTLTDEELKSVWHAGDQIEVFGGLVQMLILTGQRRTECASMKRSEINFAEKFWELPGDKTKNEMPHVVFLSDAAMKIIEAAPRFADCDLVFSTDGKTHFSGYSKGKAALDKLAPTSKSWTLHDLRRTLSTRFAKAGVPQVVTEKILNHGKGVLSGVAGIYNKFEYAEERRAAMTNWAVTLDRIVNPDAASNVVPIRAPEAVA